MDCKKVLLDDLLPFWTERLTDQECDGVFTCINGNGDVNTEKKHIWLVSRTLWTYSSVCNIYGKEKKYLEICGQAFEFLKTCTMKEGKLPFIVDREGNVIKTADNLHSEAYAAMACAAYYKVSGKDEVMQYACLYFDCAMRHYMKVLNSPEYASQNTFAVHCLVHYTARFMQEINEEYRYYSELSLENMLSEDYPHNKYGMLLEHKERRENKCCPGDVFFAAWMLLSENVQRKDARIELFVRKNLDSMERFYSEREFGLIPLSYRPEVDEQAEVYRFWPHWEALVAYTLAAKIFKDDKYKRYAKLMERTIFKYFADEPKKLFYCNIDATGKPLDFSGHGDLFHIPRALMVIDSSKTFFAASHENNSDLEK